MNYSRGNTKELLVEKDNQILIYCNEGLKGKQTALHRFYRMPGFHTLYTLWKQITAECQAFSAVIRIGSSPRPCFPPPLWLQGRSHTHSREGAWGANSDEGTDTLVL